MREETHARNICKDDGQADAYIINLERSGDRWQRIKGECEREGIRYKRIAAIDGREFTEEERAQAQSFSIKSADKSVVWNSIACLKSHVKAIKEAKSNGLERVLILEDDVELVADFKVKLKRVMEELPCEWNMLYLNGSSHYRQTEYSSLLFRVRRLSGAFGYLVNSNFYDTLIELLEGGEKPCDGYYMDIQKSSLCYLSREKLVKHLDGYSVRAEKVVAYPHLR